MLTVAHAYGRMNPRALSLGSSVPFGEEDFSKLVVFDRKLDSRDSGGELRKSAGLQRLERGCL